ncbi:hypothetical protein FQR65_LT18312 [Abscondita terminalis]|nr:hypothetical protein FQR65_LT18312 [Abscondita terminalis]
MLTIADEYPHVVVNISNEVRQVYDKHGNNFILQARTMDMIEYSIITFLNHDSFIFRENARGRFIIITQEKNIKEVFLLMWDIFAINSVVLYYDDVDKNKELIIYTSNPFSSQNNCGKVVNKIYSEFCDGDVNIRFPEAIKDFGGCPFMIGIHNRADGLREINSFWYSLKSTLTEIQLMLNITIQHLNVTTDMHHRLITDDDRSDIFFYDDMLWFGTKAEQRLNTFFTPFFMETWILIVVVFVFVVVIWWRGLVLDKFKNNQLQALFQSFSEISSLLFGVCRYDEAKNYSNQKLFIVLPKQYYTFNFDRNPKKITNKFISNDVTGSFRASFFMLPGNYLLFSINRVITFLREFGFYEKAYKDGYRLRNSESRKLIDYKFDISEVEDWNNALRINDFVGVFIVLSIGYTKLMLFADSAHWKDTETPGRIREAIAS